MDNVPPPSRFGVSRDLAAPPTPPPLSAEPVVPSLHNSPHPALVDELYDASVVYPTLAASSINSMATKANNGYKGKGKGNWKHNNNNKTNDNGGNNHGKSQQSASSSSRSTSNRLFVHLLDGPSSIGQGEKLNGSVNHRSWRHAMEIALSIKRKIGFAQGTIPKPVDDLAKLEKWEASLADEIVAFLNALGKQQQEHKLFQFLNGLDDELGP
ncbi:hypothetical protein Cgig2_021550 [Carnegiea gigantea]|uniref:Retrotransposon Copia-like N-terminal domain-containing protein n=1 Tax=Carnegiea gigantea TaxID=171969 RepID=A0A9Q1K8Q3_9CARY|nr:hypothetical protein Cgig2_021550 [Carnegiea gigantea]